MRGKQIIELFLDFVKFNFEILMKFFIFGKIHPKILCNDGRSIELQLSKNLLKVLNKHTTNQNKPLAHDVFL